MKKIFIFLFSMMSLSAFSQNDSIKASRMATRAFTLSMGNHTLYDNYISPLLYKGSDIRLNDERGNFFRKFDNKVSYQNEMELDISITQNPAKTNNIWGFGLRYFSGAHYHLRPTNRISVLVGSLANAELGVHYNRGSLGNNPVFPLCDANLWISAIGYYRIPLKSRTFVVRDHFSIPYVGVTYAPNQNQMLMDTDDCLHVTSFGSRFQLRNKLTIDLPARTCTFRVGMLAERTVININNLDVRNTTLSAIIGLSYNYVTFRGKNKVPENYITPIY